jgi:type I restriction enzyme S subunit
VKQGWCSSQLGEVCEVVNGGTPKTEVAEYWDGTNLWITPAEMGRRPSPYVDDTQRKLTDVGLQNSSAKLIPSKSVILSSRAPIGHVIINTKPMATNQGCKGLIPGPKLYYKFLYYYLTDIVDLLISLGNGATFAELSSTKLKDVQVSVPPIADQQRIVAILDAAFDAVATAKANTEKNLLNARALFDSFRESVFDRIERLNAAVEFQTLADFRNGINFTKSSRGESVEIIGVKDFQNHFVAPADNLDTVTTDGDLSDSDLVHENDILFVRSNGNVQLIGRCMLIGSITGRVTHSGFTIRARLTTDRISADYLCHFLKRTKIRNEMVRKGIGTNIKSLSQTTLRQLAVPVPAHNIQTDIVHILTVASHRSQQLESIYRRKLDALDALKKSLLHQAFTGELTAYPEEPLQQATA